MGTMGHRAMGCRLDGMGTMGEIGFGQDGDARNDDSHPTIGWCTMVYNGVRSIVETEHAMTRRL
jgi:hypothetical protein